MSCFSRNCWLQRKSGLCLWTGQITSSSESWYHETPFWAFTKVYFNIFTSNSLIDLLINRFVANYKVNHQKLLILSELLETHINKQTKKSVMTQINHYPFFIWQGHSVRRGQSHDRSECGNRVWPDAASARDGVSQHHDAHGLSEPDSGAHPEWIWAYLPLQLKQSQASSANLGKSLSSARSTFACT